VVERIYEMYTVEGLSIGEITRRINGEGIPTRKASARPSGPCCATLPIVGSPVSARRAPLHGRVSSVHCVGGVWLHPA
jgi:hypothetical protein